MTQLSNLENSRRPYDFVHDLNLIYFKFHTLDWFYPNPGYSDETTQQNGYRFDGQFFIKLSKED